MLAFTCSKTYLLKEEQVKFRYWKFTSGRGVPSKGVVWERNPAFLVGQPRRGVFLIWARLLRPDYPDRGGAISRLYPGPFVGVRGNSQVVSCLRGERFIFEYLHIILLF